MSSLRPSVLSASLSNLHSLPCSTLCAYRSGSQPHITPSRTFRRTYAQVRDGGSPFTDEPYIWPEPTPPRLNPTPYQILRQNKREMYSKFCFNHLVKLYHPDRIKHHAQNDPSVENLRNVPDHILLERYRLIVAAHNILSDPMKRRAYDLFGAGWLGASTAGAGASASSSSWYYDPDQPIKKTWKPGEDPICNATWEDWQKWHDNQNPSKEKQTPQYMSNGTMVAFITAVVAVGAMLQEGRAEAASEVTEEMLERGHREAHKELRQVRAAGGAIDSYDEGVHHFLKLRDRNTWEEESYRRMLPNQDVCKSPASDVKSSASRPRPTNV